jgi:hypothetical protein
MPTRATYRLNVGYLFFHCVSNQTSERGGSKQQLHGFELVLGFLRGLQVFLRDGKRFVAEPDLGCGDPALR